MPEQCQWYESPEFPVCGRVATVSVTLKTKPASARVHLCAQHKAVHDDNFARARNKRKTAKQ